MTCLLPNTCAFCLGTHGTHEDGCQTPQPKTEKIFASSLERWLRGGPVPASKGRRIPEERPLP